MPFLHSILTFGLAGITVLVGLFTLAWLYVLFRLRRDARTVRDIEELKPGDLGRLIIAHVPPSRRTNDPAEEIGVLKEALIRKLASGRRTMVISIALLAVLCGGTAAYAILGKPSGPVIVRQTSAGLAVSAIDPLRTLPGTWGWKFNALLSCKENPHTITLASDQRRLSIRFRAPLPSKDGGVDGYDYDVVRTGPSELVLKLIDGQGRTDGMGRPLEWSMHLDDRNTYHMKRSDVVTQDTGLIVRCNG